MGRSNTYPYFFANAIKGNTGGYGIYKIEFVKFIPEDYETGNAINKASEEVDRLNAEWRKEQNHDK